MSFKLLYHPQVKEDVAALDKQVRERIRAAIETRLSAEPALYGHPLRGTLAGFWKLRVGNWRVVYQIKADEVHILAIGHRSMIYRLVKEK